ncbi:MAG TPA: A24 family peptidase [Candidatus Cybelea sp.]|nr:A24 family peptidase [Candidatus Cybelea sp.]
MSIPIALTLAGCFIAAFIDVRSRRVPNALTASIAVAALIVHGFEGPRALGTSVAVMVILTLLGSLVYSRGGIGGGDVKLAITACGMLNFPLCIPFLLYTAIGGGLLAIGYLLVRGRTRASAVRGMLLTMSGVPGMTAKKTEGMPYAVAFAFGAIIIALSQSIAPFLRITL